MDIIPYRLDQVEKRAEAADARMARIEDRLSEIQASIAELKHSLMLSVATTQNSVNETAAATKQSVNESIAAMKDSVNQSTRNWGIGIMAIVIAAVLGIGELVIQSSNNQLTAFEAGLTAIQAVSAAPDLPPAAAPAKP